MSSFPSFVLKNNYNANISLGLLVSMPLLAVEDNTVSVSEVIVCLIPEIWVQKLLLKIYG